jgi:PPOX class probable F420-dependent enzyme
VGRLGEDDALDRFRSARVARLATVSADGIPHLVPVTFAAVGDIAVTAVDHKPKSTTRLRRLRDVEETGRVSLLVDHYDDGDWTRLWWVRVDGTAQVVEDEPERSRLAAHLVDRYEQYRQRPPAGPVIRVAIEAVTGWAYRENGRRVGGSSARKA